MIVPQVLSITRSCRRKSLPPRLQAADILGRPIAILLLLVILICVPPTIHARTPICRIDFGGPLHNAVADRDFEQVKVLVRAGANVNLATKTSRGEQIVTPLALAFRSWSTGCLLTQPDKAIISYLIENGADIEYTSTEGPAEYDGFNALHRAVRFGLLEIVETLIRKGARLEAPTAGSGQRALHIALSEGQYEAAELLLKSGANPNALDARDASFTPLHVAARNPGPGNRSVKLLMQYGAKYKITRLKGPFYQLWHCGCVNNKDFEELVDLLTAAGGDKGEFFDKPYGR